VGAMSVNERPNGATQAEKAADTPGLRAARHHSMCWWRALVSCSARPQRPCSAQKPSIHHLLLRPTPVARVGFEPRPAAAFCE